MKLDRTTYEAWLLDRIEGNLTPEQERELDAFLSAHPDLSADLDELPTISRDGAAFNWKSELKKSIPPVGEPDAARLTDFLIARGEGDLSPAQLSALQRYMAEHPEASREEQLVALARVTDKSAAFADKLSIERHFPPQGMPDMHRLDDFLVGRMEGDLTLQQRTALDALIATDAHAAKQWAAMQRARVPLEKIVFAHKEQLKKRSARVIPIGGSPWMKLAAAASIALVLGLGWVMLRDNEQGPVVAEQPDVMVPEKNDQDNGAEEKKNAGPSEVVNEQGNKSDPPSGVNADADQGQGQEQGQEQEREQEQGQEATSPVVPLQQPPPMVPRQREAAPAMAQVQQPALEREEVVGRPVQVNVAPGVPPAPLNEPVAAAITTAEHHTVGELIAGTLRREVLDQRSATAHAFDGNDAVAAIDKGLGAISADRAGLDVQRGKNRSRFRLRLGDLALSASRGR